MLRRGSWRQEIQRALLGRIDREKELARHLPRCQPVEHCAAANYRQMVAVIGDSANHASIGLHEGLGFRRIGLQTAVGFKHGRWIDSVLMQRPLGSGASTDPMSADR